jgi:plasmid stability protein
MPSLTIRNLDGEVKARLRVRAARNGRSMEAEAREVLAAAVSEPEELSVAALEEIVRDIQAAFAPYRIPKVSVVDELIAERRLEAWTERVVSMGRQKVVPGQEVGDG